MKRHIAHELEARHDHPAHPEVDNLPRRAVHVVRIEGAKVLGLVRPSKRRKGPKSGREPRVEDVRVLRDLAIPAFGAFTRPLDCNRPMAVRAVVHGHAMAEPELAADVPVAESVKPIEVCALVALGVPPHLAVGRRRERFVAHLVHPQPPLFADQRLDDRIAAIAMADLVRVWLFLDEESLCLEVSNHELSRLERRQAVVRQTRHVHPPVEVHAVDDLEVMALADLVIHRVVARRDLERPGAEVLLHCIVSDDGQLPPHQRQDRDLADDRLVARVGRVNGHARVGEHRLGPDGGDHDLAPALDRVADEVQRVVVLFPLHLEVGDGRLVVRAPVDDARGAVDPAAVVERDECGHHRPHIPLVHREAQARPVQ